MATVQLSRLYSPVVTRSRAIELRRRQCRSDVPFRTRVSTSLTRCSRPAWVNEANYSSAGTDSDAVIIAVRIRQPNDFNLTRMDHNRELDSTARVMLLVTSMTE